MKTEALQDALCLIRDDYILDAHAGPAVCRTPRLRWGALAACLCILAVVAALKLLHKAPAPPISDPGPGPITEPDPQPVGPLGDWPVVYNQVTAIPDEGKYAFCLFSEKLTEEERSAIIPDGLPDWLDVQSATALYYGWDEGVLNGVELSMVNPDTGDRIELRICPPEQQPIYDEIFAPEDAVPTEIDGEDVVLCQCRGMLWTSFSGGGVDYYVAASGQMEEMDRLKEDFFLLVVSLIRSATSPDLERLQFHPEQHVFQERDLTPEEARLDPDFGAYFPTAEPDGLVREQISRLQNSDYSINNLAAFWHSGYDYLTWQIRYSDEYDARRIVSPEERERYDLALYSLPLAESVPEKYRETVMNPVFRSEELTEEMVLARCSAFGDSGEGRDAPWINFSVLFDSNVLVDITGKNVSPEWIWAQLNSMR